jgi:hypothetical protein
MEQNDNGPKSGPVRTERLHFEDRDRMRDWVKALRDAANDAVAAGTDATRRFSKRVLSRAEARRKLRDAERSIEGLLAVAERALETK